MRYIPKTRSKHNFFFIKVSEQISGGCGNVYHTVMGEKLIVTRENLDYSVAAVIRDVVRLSITLLFFMFALIGYVKMQK